MRALPCFLLITALSLPAAAQQPVTRDALISALSGFESQPDASEVRRWGAGAVPLLASVIDDADVMVGARARAAYALRVFLSDPAALSLLQRLVAQADGNLFVRLAAMDALAEGGAPPRPDHRAARLARQRPPRGRCGVAVAGAEPLRGARGPHRAAAGRDRPCGAPAA